MSSTPVARSAANSLTLRSSLATSISASARSRLASRSQTGADGAVGGRIGMLRCAREDVAAWDDLYVDEPRRSDERRQLGLE